MERAIGTIMLAVNLDEISAGTRVTADLVVAGQTVNELRVPLVVLRGRLPRPLLVLMAGIHGDEYNGIKGLQELANDWDPATLLGTVIIIPVANPLAFAAVRRSTPEDDLDLNRVFPGDASGTITRRLAHALSEGVLRHADLVFTLHGAECVNALVPWIEFLDLPLALAKTTWTHARASGFTDLIGLPQLTGTLQTAMIPYGVPVIEGEVGGRGTLEPESVRYYRDRAADVAESAGVLPRRPGAGTPPQSAVWHMQAIVAPATGILSPMAGLGHRVNAGQRLGLISDICGAVVGEIVAEYDGVVGARREHSGLLAGDAAFILWIAPDADAPSHAWDELLRYPSNEEPLEPEA